jgi:recombinational DNA repair protein RecR
MKIIRNLLRVTSVLIILMMCLICCDKTEEEVCADCYNQSGSSYTICAYDRLILREKIRLEELSIGTTCNER